MADDTDLRRELEDARATIRALQDELAETNRGLIALTMELETRVEERTAELEAANHELSMLYERTKALDQLKTRFFANVSHELRTPLTLILGPIDALLAGVLDDGARAQLEVVARNARLLLQHVNDLLDVAKLEAGKMEVIYVREDLARLLRVTASHFEVLAAERRIALSVDAPQTLPAQVDAEKLRRVVVNLLANAFKFTPDGGAVACRLRAAGGQARISVEDTGPGVPPALRERIFEPFHQGEEAATRPSGGTGLGLAIVKEFVELQGGTAGVGDAPGGGARFEVTVPLVAPPGARVGWPLAADDLRAQDVRQAVEALRPVARGAQQEIPARAGGPLVLVVEDNPDMNRFIAQTLAGQYRTAGAYDGREGLERALALRPDVILTDIMMPVMGGDELVRAIRAHPECDGIPIILLTARADDELRAQLLRTGAQDYLVKPFATEELRARVGNLITMKRVRETLQRDLSSRLHDLEELAREVAARRAEAERANLAKDQFLSHAAHELRTPLTALLGNLELAASRVAHAATGAGAAGAELAPTLATVQDLHRRANRQIDRLARLVDDLLDVSRIQEGRLEMRMAPCDLAALVREAVGVHRYPIPPRPLRLALPAGEAVPVVADADRIQQVVINYVTNALKFAPPDRPIEVGVQREDGQARVWVRDEGPGVAQDEQERIWERGYQVGVAQHSGSRIGLGLGLYISRSIVEGHGGQVGVESAPGQGATFWFTLPLASPAP